MSSVWYKLHQRIAKLFLEFHRPLCHLVWFRLPFLQCHSLIVTLSHFLCVFLRNKSHIRKKTRKYILIIIEVFLFPWGINCITAKIYVQWKESAFLRCRLSPNSLVQHIKIMKSLYSVRSYFISLFLGTVSSVGYLVCMLMTFLVLSIRLQSSFLEQI